MSAEFSLLQHLGVSVDRCEPARAVQSSDIISQAPRKDAFRVWAPAQHPPANKTVSTQQVHGVLDSNRKGSKKSYADPTGEVLVRHEHGTETQYVVYNSKIPSVYGVNKQLAERKRTEKARENAAESIANCGLEFGLDEAQQEKARKHILRELQMCNRDQADRRKEEERRGRERRIAQEREQLRYREAEAMRSEEEARFRKLQHEEELRRAADDAVAAKRKAAAAAESTKGRSYSPTWDGADEDERRLLAAQRRSRDFAEANQKLAEQQRAERIAHAAAERERAYAERTANAQRMCEEQTHEAAKHREAAELLRAAQEAERERRLVAASSSARGSPAPTGSLFDFAEQRESEEAQRAHQRLREDMAINAGLAEVKRTQAKEERQRERAYAARVANANFEDFQRDIAESRLRRRQEQEELQNAAETAAAQKRERQKHEALVSRSRPTDLLLFWGHEDSARAEESRAKAQRHFYEEVRRQAERKQAERTREEKLEKARERALVEYDNEVAKEAAARERQESHEKIAELRHTLEGQIAAKKQRARHHDPSSQSDILRVPAPEVESLYRCPVTHELFPASAYDFGIARGR